jgi:hypothetical protein
MSVLVNVIHAGRGGVSEVEMNAENLSCLRVESSFKTTTGPKEMLKKIVKDLRLVVLIGVVLSSNENKS